MNRKFGHAPCAAIVARLEIGKTFSEAAVDAGIKLPTAQGWRARGNREDEGPYHDFAVAVEKALAREQPEPMTAEEHRLKVAEVARRGNVQALKLYWEMIRADRGSDEGEDEEQTPAEGLDELAARRAAG